MPYDKEYVIRLNGFDLGQMVDGLEARLNAWRRTAQYLNSEGAGDDFLIEECDDAGEAMKIADHYDRLIQLIVAQQRQQDQGLVIPNK